MVSVGTGASLLMVVASSWWAGAPQVSKHGAIWVGGPNGVLRVHDVNSGEMQRAWLAHNGGVADLCLCPPAAGVYMQ